MNEITVYNVADTIREKVKATIVESIPKEQIDGLIKTEYNKFFDQPGVSSWDKPKLSPFQELVNEAIKAELQERLKAAIKAEVDKLGVNWNATAGSYIESTTKQLGPALLEGLVGSMVNNAVMRLRQDLQSGRF